jgi:hypothetical protein
MDWFNAGGISPQAVAFFTAILGAVGGLFKYVNDGRRESRGANQAAVEAKESAEQAAKNTQNVSNGFASTVLAELRGIREDQAELSASVNRHLEWHLKNGEK